MIIATGKQHVRQLTEPMRGRVERISMAESHLWHSNFARRRACLSIMQGRKTPTIRPIQSTIHIVAPPHVASAIGAIGQVPSETAGPRSTEAGQDDEEYLGPRVPSPPRPQSTRPPLVGHHDAWLGRHAGALGLRLTLHDGAWPRRVRRFRSFVIFFRR